MKESNGHLQKNLKNRHIQMIALGGAIGTGLFYGSAQTIQMAGPAISLSYLIVGLIVFFIMRALGEMLVYKPSSGSFSEYANEYWGHFPGFFAGWHYWVTYIIVGMTELAAAGIYINYWFPSIPPWITSLIFLVIITLVNLVDVKAFGEFEFWFAIIKVAAIVCMIIIGIFIIFYHNTGFDNLWKHGGFAPHGTKGILFSLVIALFSFGGLELIGTTAGETSDPQKTIPKAINQSVRNIIIFYVGTLLVMLTLFRWDLINTNSSPFVLIFSNVGIPYAGAILNLVVLTACLSAYNSGLYSNGRMLYGLSEQGNAPKMFSKLNKNGVPARAILISSLLTLFAIIPIFIMREKAFLFLATLTTLAFIINWGMIVIIHFKFRKKVDKNTLSFKVPFYPFTSYLGLAFLGLVAVLISYIQKNIIYAMMALPFWFLALYIAFKIQKSRSNNEDVESSL